MARHHRDQDLLDRFGANVERLRRQAGMTQQAVADRLGVRPESVSQIESGRQSPTLTSLVGLAKALGVEPSALLQFEGTPVPDPAGADEHGLLADYRKLSEDAQRTIRAVALGLQR